MEIRKSIREKYKTNSSLKFINMHHRLQYRYNYILYLSIFRMAETDKNNCSSH